jgi:ferredoxin
MGHIHDDNQSGDNRNRKIYQKLGEKIDGMPIRVPWNEEFYEVVKALYSSDEADVVARMPYTFSNLARIARVTRYDKSKLLGILDSLTSKGLVIDVFAQGEYFYMPSPLFIGIYEFTLMKTNGLNTKEKARFLHTYKESSDLHLANFSDDKKVSFMRSLPHEETIKPEDYTEILDYEKAYALIKATDTYSLGNCSCRTDMAYVGEKKCDTPFRTCIGLGMGADYLIRNQIGQKVSQSEMLEAIAISKEYKLVINADNVQRNPTYICQCCHDCCGTLTAISKYGYPRTIVTSSFIANIVNQDECLGCGKCSNACPIKAIKMVEYDNAKSNNKKVPVIDKNMCLGCGVCALNCKSSALRLIKREQKVIHPETSFERVILQSLERGTLQNQLFDDPGSITHKTMRYILGAFLNLDPVKQALMSDTLRSSFLKTMKIGVKISGRAWFLEI